MIIWTVITILFIVWASVHLSQIKYPVEVEREYLVLKIILLHRFRLMVPKILHFFKINNFRKHYNSYLHVFWYPSHVCYHFFNLATTSSKHGLILPSRRSAEITRVSIHEIANQQAFSKASSSAHWREPRKASIRGGTHDLRESSDRIHRHLLLQDQIQWVGRLS